MGVHRCDYVILGVCFTFEEFYKGCSHCNNEDGTERYEKYAEPYEDDGYNQEITAPDGFAVVSDGMDGKYAVIGRILAKSPQGAEGFAMTDLMARWTLSEAAVLKMLIRLSFPFLDVGDRKVTLLLFSHFH